MAEQCTPIAIILDDGATSINYCWEDGFIEPGWAAKNVVMGLRKSWQTCQYFIKGLYPKCTSWNEEAGKCTFADNQKTDIPSGYNSSKCDFLGRRSWCTKYAPSGDVVAEEPKYFCIAPNPYLSGLGKSVEGQPSLRVAIPNTEIKGYNKGQCDCYGMGRGEAGCGIGSTYAGTQNAKAEEELAKLPCVCNYYRPFQMGFGAQSPHEIRKLDGTLDIEAMKKLVATGVEMETRLPLSFVVYNYRANTQKCQWYEKDAGSNFILNTNSEIDLEDGGAVTYCKCTDSAANPFKTKSNKTGFRLEKVWAEGDTILCNGAKPECPSYTGKWTYCKDDRMRPGMPISAQQVFELRFWANDWETQEQYDKAYQLKPNPQDKPTAAIFTFDKWKGATTKAEDNVLTGFKVEMCQPAPAHNKVFEPSLYLKTTSVNFSDAFVNKGSTSSNAPLFPSLIRIPDFSLTAPLQVVYPYVDDDVFDAEVCKVRSSSSSSGMIKRTNDYRGDYIHVVGYTMRNREVFVINTSGPDGSPTTIRSYDSMLAVPRSEKSNVTKSLVDYINQLTRKGNEYIVRGVSSDFGGFLISPLKLVWGDNNILICVDFGDGTWEFKKRKVVSKWYGAVVIQTEFKQTYDAKNKEGYEYSYNKPDPKGTAKAKIITLSPNISLHSIVPTSRVDDIKKNTLTYNYAIVEKTESNKIVTKWAPVGQSEYVWAEVEDLELNYLLPREVVSAKMVGKGKTLELEENTSLYTNYLQPNVFIFSITNFKDNRQVFNPKDWTLTITYKFQKIVSHDAVGDGTVIFPTDGSLGSIPVDLSITSGFINFKSVYQTTMSFMALFKDEKGRVISSFATKLLNSMCKVECRSVEMWYSYHADAFNYTLVPEWGKCVNVKGAARLAGGGFSCGGASSHATKGPCGDHDIKMSSGLGPVWFPFNKCETYFKYNKPQPPPIYPGIGYCSSCMSAIIGPTSMSLDGTRNNRLQVLQPDGKTYKQAAWHRIDYRYRMPDLYESRSEMRVYDFAFMKPCFCFCMHYYSDCSMSAVIFGGWANISARVDRDKYIKYRWTLPPFGNKGRDLIERFLSQDCVMHEVLYQMPFDTDEDGNPITDADGNPLVEYRIPEPDFEWMPMVMDHSMFFMSFNSFDSNGETLDLVSENLYGFNFVNQLNFMTLSNITEAIDSVTRYSFDDVFDIRFEEKCTYPLPLLPKGDSGSSVAFYTFKEDSTAWAWQETWKQIERAKEGTEQIKCVRLVRPNYIYDAYKKEHSVICSEGMHTIHLRGYNPEEKKDAQISLDGVNYRSFDIIYGNPSGGTWTYDSESYNADYVDWLDVGGGGDTGGSSKSDNIYEVTSDENDWAHPKNMIFSVEASKEKLDSRKITKINESGSESHQYYNRGLVAQIRKDFLEFLPKNFYECTLNGKDAAFNLTGGKFGCALTGPAQYNWQETYSLLPGKFIFNTSTVSFASADSITPCNIASISIEGYYGRINTTNLVTKKASNLSFVQPGISITAKTEDGDEYTLRGFASNSVTPKTLNMHKDTKSFTENYSAKFLLPLSPIEMVKKRITKFTINLFGLPDYFIAINDLKVEFAEYKKEASEDVFVWERKYNISQYSPEDELNPDGPSYILKSDIDESNAGQYFSFSELYKTESKLLTNKIRGALFERSIEDDEAVPITIDTVLDVEKEKQKELYTAAYDLEDLKELNYNTMLPDTIFKNLPESATGGVSGGCKITIPKIPWDSLKLVKEFVQFPLWRVNGHRFVWADQYNEEPCRERQFYYGVHLHEH